MRSRPRCRACAAPSRSHSCSRARRICWSARARARRSRSATARARCISAPTRSRSRRSPTRSAIWKTATGRCVSRDGVEVHDVAGNEGRARGAEIERLGVPGRQGQPSPFHGEGNPRAARSRRPHARALSRHGGRAGAHAARCRSISASINRISISACGTAYYAGLVAKYWFERFARLPVEIDVASEFRYREAPFSPGGLAIFVSQSGETADTLATLALRQGAEAAHPLDRERADLDDRARKRRGDADARRARDRRRLDQGVHLPALGARLPRDRGRPGARRAVRGRRAQAGARADRGAAPDGRGARSSSRRSSSSRATSRRAATCSISAAARPIRSRSKAR